MKRHNYVCWAHHHFILSCVSAKKRRASSSEREWWCRSADKHQWTCIHRVWTPMNAAKRDWVSCNHDKACGFRTNAKTEPPLLKMSQLNGQHFSDLFVSDSALKLYGDGSSSLFLYIEQLFNIYYQPTKPPLDQSWSYCCRRWAQLSVSWHTTAVIPWKWKQNRQILWRSSAVLKLVVPRQFSNKNRQCVILGYCSRALSHRYDLAKVIRNLWRPVIILENNHAPALCSLCSPLTVKMHVIMMTSSNGNIFRVTGHLCGEFTDHR